MKMRYKNAYMIISNTEVVIPLFGYEYFEHKLLYFSYIFVPESDDDFIRKNEIYKIFWKTKKSRKYSCDLHCIWLIFA